MEIRCGDAVKWELLLFGIGILAAILLLRDIRALVLIGIFFLCIPYFLYRFRRFRMDETGVEITCLGCFQKYYPWESFVVKQMVQPLYNPGFDMYKKKRGRRHPRHHKPVLLSLKPILVPSCVNYGYIMWHPLSCVFIGFEDEFPTYKHEYTHKTERELRDFEVNREEFVSKMKEWGVEIKGLTDRQE